MSIKDIDKLDALTRQIEELRRKTVTEQTPENERFGNSVDQLSRDMEKLKSHTRNSDDKDEEK